MPIPEFDQYPKGEVPLCAGTLISDGTSGCKTPEYELDHSNPDKWAKPKKDTMKTFVAKTPNISWHPIIVTSKWLGIKHIRNTADRASDNPKV